MKITDFMNVLTCTLTTLFLALTGIAPSASAQPPNILFAMADDWSWPHTSAYGAAAIHTPAFDSVAKNGMLFHNAFVAAPQCSPNRASILTGRNIWQLEEAGTHASIFPNKFIVFPDLLQQAGYHVGFTGKGWGPGDWSRGGWPQNPAGNEYNNHTFDTVPASGINNKDYAENFNDYLRDREGNQPFFFWFGGHEPHRSYEAGSGQKAGKDPAQVVVPGFLPDTPLIRQDMLDYFVEIEWFDTQLAKMLAILEQRGELDNTIVVVTGDNGMPFPRAKANLYEHGIHVPLAIQWPRRIQPNSTTDALVSFIDFAPTFLATADIIAPDPMTGVNFLPLLLNQVDAIQQHIFAGRERHTHARYDNLAYPARAIRTPKYLYIRNFKPDLWPAGDPPKFHDIDGCPTKSFMLNTLGLEHDLTALAVAKRPAEELYDIVADPDCLTNLAHSKPHKKTTKALAKKLIETLTQQNDPRAKNNPIFDSYPRVSHMRPELGGFAERHEYNPKYAAKP